MSRPKDQGISGKELKVLGDTAGPVIPAGHPFHLKLNYLQPDVTIETEIVEKRPIGIACRAQDPLERKERSNKSKPCLHRAVAV
jgi:hypothetical protein